MSDLPTTTDNLGTDRSFMVDRAAKTLKGATNIFLKDLEALPESAFAQSFGDATRTVADIVYEVKLVNDHVTLTLRNEPLFDWPDGGWIVAPDDFRGKETIIEQFKSSADKMISTVEGFTEADMATKVTTEHGETDVFERCQFMALHMWYHSGQLNYVQTLLGDTKWHW